MEIFNVSTTVWIFGTILAQLTVVFLRHFSTPSSKCSTFTYLQISSFSIPLANSWSRFTWKNQYIYFFNLLTYETCTTDRPSKIKLIDEAINLVKRLRNFFLPEVVTSSLVYYQSLFQVQFHTTKEVDIPVSCIPPISNCVS